MRVKIEIPERIEDIKLGKYQDFIEVTKNDKETLVIQSKLLQTFCGIQTDGVKVEDIDSIATDILKLFKDSYELKRTFKLKGIEFGFIPNLEEMTLGEYIDLDNYMLELEDLHKAMAVLFRPIVKRRKAWFNKKEEQYKIDSYTGTEKYGDLMKEMPVDVALGAQFFFINLRKELLRNTMNFLEEDQKVMSLIAKHNLDQNGDGITVSMPLLREMLDL